LTLDIRGSIKNTDINRNPFVVLDELFSNAIDAYLIRNNSSNKAQFFEVSISISVSRRALFDDQHDLLLSFTDNGSGLGGNETKAFVTKDTSFKDDLAIKGIGRCKGSGRIQYLHYFSKLEISSDFVDNGKIKTRKLKINENTREVDENSFSVSDSQNNSPSTTVKLYSLKDEVYEKVFNGLNLVELFSASSVKNHLLISHLQRLVSLCKDLGDFVVKVESKFDDQVNSDSLTFKELPKKTASRSIKVSHADFSNSHDSFEVSHYKLPVQDFELTKNTVALCAKSSIVKDITSRYLKTKTIENNSINDHYHIIFIESSYLDNHVNEQRDEFKIPKDKQPSESLLGTPISFEDLYDHIDSVIENFIEPPGWDKNDILDGVEGKYGISPSMINEASVRVRYGDTEETVVKRVLSSYQEKIISDTSEIFNIKEEVRIADPKSDKFRDKINDLAWKYTSSIKTIDMANLSQLVVRRAAMLEVLDLAINKNLDLQNGSSDSKREDEKLIHNIFFPMRKDSSETSDHDIWILNEEYHYYDHIASDQPLSKIKWDAQSALFDSDIDDELDRILTQTNKQHARKRPDIAIFSKEGSAIVIEFKSPDVSMDDHVGDLMEYSQLLAAKSKGRIKKFYGYLVGKSVNPHRLIGYTRFPSGRGWFSTNPIVEPTSYAPLGELYSEIVFYEDVVDRAKKRLEVFKQKLGLKIS